MTNRVVPVACLQVSANERSAFSTRWPQTLGRVEEAAARGARLIVLPEGGVPSYVIGTQPVEPSLLAGALEDVSRIARLRNCVVVFGTARPVPGGLRNSACVVDADGSVRGYADKLFLWHFDSRWFEGSDAVAPIETSLGKLGVLICADGRLPNLAAALVEGGAELLVIPTAWVTSGRDPAALENLQADLMIGVRARENGVPLLAANKVGSEAGSVLYCGKSAIVDADGAFVARASQTGEETLHATIALGRAPSNSARGGRAAVATASPGFASVARPAGEPTAKRRFAIAAEAISREERAMLAVADVELLILPEKPGTDSGLPAVIALDGVVPGSTFDAGSVRMVAVNDRMLLDPRALVPFKLGGGELVLWDTTLEAPWTERFARTRAAELRVYVVAIDRRARRAFVADPDGVILAGTLGEFRAASFTFERARVLQRTVAPGTDVVSALSLVERLTAARMFA